MSDSIGAGDFIPWEGGCALIGRSASVVHMHAHYALQIGIGSEFGIRFRSDDRTDWMSYDTAIIPSRQPHAMDATGVPFSAVLLIEPETPQGRALAELYLAGGIASHTSSDVAAARTVLFESWRQHGNDAATRAALQHVVEVLTHGVRASTVSDERVLRAIAYIRSHIDAPLTLEDVAGEACLSPSRFRHLFVEQTGTALRPYVLWRRFLKAWEHVLRGDALSTAAHAAGFADAAHLTRTSHRMFGFAPSALQLNVHRVDARQREAADAAAAFASRASGGR
jgi:AraC family transcriptional regulator